MPPCPLDSPGACGSGQALVPKRFRFIMIGHEAAPEVGRRAGQLGEGDPARWKTRQPTWPHIGPQPARPGGCDRGRPRLSPSAWTMPPKSPPPWWPLSAIRSPQAAGHPATPPRTGKMPSSCSAAGRCGHHVVGGPPAATATACANSAAKLGTRPTGGRCQPAPARVVRAAPARGHHRRGFSA